MARLAYDADLSGLIVLPTVSLHARHDPVVAFAAEAAYARTVAAAGRQALLLQGSTDEAEHSRLDDESYRAALRVLEDWLDQGQRPATEAFQRACLAAAADPARCRYGGP